MRQAPIVTMLPALLASALAASAHAAITVAGVATHRWGQTNGAIGISDGTLESFEDAALAPGLQVEWQSSAGSFGPTATLPNIFNPVADDPFGNAFDVGIWDGLRGLISARENRTYDYNASSNWGDLILHFDPPVRAVGFSLEQMQFDARLVVNGVDRGGVASLAGLTLGGARNGYVLVQATEADTISTIKLDNGGGDGFVIDHLKYSTTPMPRITATGFGTQLWGAPDGALGFAALAVEDFEDTTLIPQLLVSCESPAGNAAPANTLPSTFDPVAEDAFGNAFDQGVWDGMRCLINTRTNQTFSYPITENWGDVIFNFNPPQTSIGFSFQQMQMVGRLVVNGRDVGQFPAIAGLSIGEGRIGYVRIDGQCPETQISEIRINNARGDGITFDHLAILRCYADLDNGGGTGCDGAIDINDLLFFLTAFEAGTTVADLDDGSFVGIPDGAVDINDLLFFLTRFEAGC